MGPEDHEEYSIAEAMRKLTQQVHEADVALLKAAAEWKKAAAALAFTITSQDAKEAGGIMGSSSRTGSEWGQTDHEAYVHIDPYKGNYGKDPSVEFEPSKSDHRITLAWPSNEAHRDSSGSVQLIVKGVLINKNLGDGTAWVTMSPAAQRDLRDALNALYKQRGY